MKRMRFHLVQPLQARKIFHLEIQHTELNWYKKTPANNSKTRQNKTILLTVPHGIILESNVYLFDYILQSIFIVPFMPLHDSADDIKIHNNFHKFTFKDIFNCNLIVKEQFMPSWMMHVETYSQVKQNKNKSSYWIVGIILTIIVIIGIFMCTLMGKSESKDFNRNPNRKFLNAKTTTKRNWLNGINVTKLMETNKQTEYSLFCVDNRTSARQTCTNSTSTPNSPTKTIMSVRRINTDPNSRTMVSFNIPYTGKRVNKQTPTEAGYSQTEGNLANMHNNNDSGTIRLKNKELVVESLIYSKKIKN